VVVVVNSHLSIDRGQKGDIMTSTNIIEFAPVLQRRKEQQITHAAHLGRSAPWHNRYRDGIDGLLNTRKVRTSSGEVVPFVATGSRQNAAGDLRW
jgi:hypothetical protein